ncbi:MAG: hypothetical protein Q4E12_07990 [Coriobacteriia bacterium]|nr:hypothetical protein [Coriobacteriia bacterium]
MAEEESIIPLVERMLHGIHEFEDAFYELPEDVRQWMLRATDGYKVPMICMIVRVCMMVEDMANFLGVEEEDD